MFFFIILLDYGSCAYMSLIFNEPFIFTERFLYFQFLFFFLSNLIVLEMGVVHCICLLKQS